MLIPHRFEDILGHSYKAYALCHSLVVQRANTNTIIQRIENYSWSFCGEVPTWTCLWLIQNSTGHLTVS